MTVNGCPPAQIIIYNSLEKEKAVAIATAFFRVSDKIRTRDLLVRSQTLYPAELHLRNTNIL